ncbi:MAG: hypothetical protein KGJ86_21820, partial [Chloroflexota bacterium]|nr:hypothetical protein [Chloroflexota bacterium]
MRWVRVLLQVQLLLPAARLVGQKGKVGIQAGSHLTAHVWWVHADGRRPGVGHVHFGFELNEPAQLPLVLWSEQAAVEDQHHRVFPLDLR